MYQLSQNIDIWKNWPNKCAKDTQKLSDKMCQLSQNIKICQNWHNKCAKSAINLG